MEKILNNNRIIKIKKIGLINLNENNENNDLKDLNKNDDKDIITTKVSTPFIDTINNDINSEDNDNDSLISDNKNRILPKFSFMQFFLSNLQCKKCNIRKEQKILNICNTIIMKYLSVDSILNNQIIMENLFKDYLWNNSSLSVIENNELILKLKNLIS